RPYVKVGPVSGKFVFAILSCPGRPCGLLSRASAVARFPVMYLLLGAPIISSVLPLFPELGKPQPQGSKRRLWMRLSSAAASRWLCSLLSSSEVSPVLIHHIPGPLSAEPLRSCGTLFRGTKSLFSPSLSMSLMSGYVLLGASFSQPSCLQVRGTSIGH
uniref:Uncharacterized protein n=1 Tax=Lynx canadensis TaxID=61383 RepID=A0A667HZ23_LYNCA